MASPTSVRFASGALFRCLTILKQQAWICIWDGIGLSTLLLLAAAVATYNGPHQWAVYGIGGAITVTYAGLLAAAAFFVIAHARSARVAMAKETVPPVPLSA